MTKHKHIGIGGVLAACVFAIASPSFAAIRHVKADAAGANNGTSWTDAYADLQSALTVAVSDDEIWVAAGTYIPKGGYMLPGYPMSPAMPTRTPPSNRWTVSRSTAGLASRACQPVWTQDDDADQSDLDVFQGCFSGKAKPADPNCANHTMRFYSPHRQWMVERSAR